MSDEQNFESTRGSVSQRLLEISMRLVRSEERQKTAADTLKEMKEAQENFADRIIAQIENIRHDFKEELGSLKKDTSENLKNNYVEKSEFSPVKKLVFGFVAATLLAFGGLITAQMKLNLGASAEQPPAISSRAKP